MSVKLITLGILCAFMASCGGNDETVEWDKTSYKLDDYGTLPEPIIAADNELTVQGVKLGRMLFYDKLLSADGTQACASCHMQEFAFTDTARFSIGIQGKKGKRQAMSVFNMAWHGNEFFWDGRSHLLRDQALLPIQDELEMDEELDNVVQKLNEDVDYRNQFKRAFGTDNITPEYIALALEQFMNSIVSADSKYDKYLAGSYELTESEARGMKLFNTEYNQFFPEESGADCQHCHSGYNFENDMYMNNGLDTDGEFSDLGREIVTNDAADRGKFKVTTLRNIELTAPYMHDGRFNTLEEVIDHYNEGIKASSTLDLALEQTRYTGLMLSEQDKKDLIAFLKTLTDNSLLTNPKYNSPF
ncbi:MAG: cytochrome-c peroxidase [Bacteroidia bacterium]